MLILYATFVIVCALSFHAVDTSATHALKVALNAQTFINDLKKEKVCTDSNRGEACRDLFNRLATSISEEQRFRLACVVLHAIGEEKWMSELGCPPILPNPGANPNGITPHHRP